MKWLEKQLLARLFQQGRHLVTMPHIERSTFQWNWAHYPENRSDSVSPWLEGFVNARRWLESL